MTQTTTNHDEDLAYWKGLLRQTLADAPKGPVEVRVRKIANRALNAGTLSVYLLKQLVRELEALTVPGTPVPDKPVVEPPAPQVRTTRFDAACQSCGTLVQAGTGILARGDGAWTVNHAEGQCVPEGRYAVVIDGIVKFFKLKGKEVFAMASDELHLLVGDPYIAQVLGLIAADFRAAFALYGQEIGRCGICGFKLTSEWRLVGIGPKCNKKYGWV